MQVRGDPGREAHEREHDVLDALAHVALAARLERVRLLVGEVQQDRDVVRAKAPQRVLLGPQLAQVQAIAVDVVDRPQLAGRRDLLELVHARVVLEQVADHEHPARRARRLDRALGVGDRLRERLLDEAVLARLEHADRERGVGGDGRGEDGRVKAGVAEKGVWGAGEARPGMADGEALAHGRVGVAAPAQLGARERVEVAGEVRAPVAEADDADRDRRGRACAHSSTAARSPLPLRVTPRRSRASGARSTMASWSTPGCAVTITARSTPSSASSKPTPRRPCSTSSGTCGSWYTMSAPRPLSTSMIFSAGDSRRSPTPAL